MSSATKLTIRQGLRFSLGATLLLAAFVAGLAWRTSRPKSPARAAPLSSTTSRPALQAPPAPGARGKSTRGGARGGFQRVDAFRPRNDYTTKWAILIGVNQYRDDGGFGELKYAVNDASELKELLIGEFGYQQNHVRLLKNGGATRADVESVFTEWLPGGNPVESDSILVFFAGHGTRDGYLACADSRRHELESTGVSVAQMKDWLQQIPRSPSHKLVILDSCYSGKLFQRRADSPEDSAVVSAPPGSVRRGDTAAWSPGPSEHSRLSGQTDQSAPSDTFDRYSYYLRWPAFIGMSSGRNTTVQDGSETLRHSPFTAALLRALRERGNTTRPDHVFRFGKVAEMVQSEVNHTTEQVPMWGRLDDGEGDFIFRPEFRRKTPREVSEARAIAAALRLYAMQIAAARREWELGNVDQAWRHLNACRWDLRGWEHDYLHSLFTHNQQIIEDAVDGRFSPDGARLLSFGRGEEKLWDVATGRLVADLSDHEIARAVFSPDGAQILDRGDRIFDATTGKPTLAVETSPELGRSSGRFSSDGALILNKDDRLVCISDASDGALKFKHTLVRGEDRESRPFDVSPDLRRLLDNPERGELRLFDTTTRREIRRWHGHEEEVQRVQFSPNSQFVASFEAKRIKVWNGVTGELATTIDADEHPGQFVTRVDFSPNDQLLACYFSSFYGVDTYRCESVEVRDVVTGELKATIRADDHPQPSIAYVDFSPDSRLLACNFRHPRGSPAAGPPGAQLWDIAANAGPWAFEQAYSIASFSSDSRRLFVSTAGGVQVWDAASQQMLSELEVEAGAGARKLISPDGNWIAVRTGRHTFKLWDVIAGEYRATCKGHHDLITDWKFSPDSQRLLSRSAPGKTIRLWKTPSQQPAETRTGWPIRMSPDGRWIAANAAGGIHVWDAVTLEERARLDDLRSQQFCFTSNGEGILACRENEVGLFPLFPHSSSTPARIWPGAAPETHALASDWPRRIAVAGGGYVGERAPRRLVGEIRVYDLQAGAAPIVIEGFEARVRALAFSADGNWIASGDDAGAVQIWDARTGRQRHTLPGHNKGVQDVAFTPDGARVVSAGKDGAVKIWDAGSGAHQLTLRGHAKAVRNVSVHPDGTRVVSAGEDDSVRVWETTLGQELLHFKLADVREAFFAPAGGRIVASPMLRIWDGRWKLRTRTLEGHAGPIYDIVYSPDARMIASCSADRSVRIWDAVTGEQLQILHVRDGSVRDVEFSRDGRRIVAGNPNSVRVWDVESGRLVLAIPRLPSEARQPAESDVACGEGWIAAKGVGVIDILDASTGKTLHTLIDLDRQGSIRAHPDGARLIAESHTGAVKIWDAMSGVEMTAKSGDELGRRVWKESTTRALSEIPLSFHRYAVRPDEREVAGARADHSIRIWPLTSRGDMAAAGRGLK